MRVYIIVTAWNELFLLLVSCVTTEWPAVMSQYYSCFNFQLWRAGINSLYLGSSIVTLQCPKLPCRAYWVITVSHQGIECVSLQQTWQQQRIRIYQHQEYIFLCFFIIIVAVAILCGLTSINCEQLSCDFAKYT